VAPKSKPEGIVEFESEGQVYSTCVRVDDKFHFSGTIGLVQEGRMKSDGDFKAQTMEVMHRMMSMLDACGLTPNDVYSATVMLAGDMSGYAHLNKIWNDLFGSCAVKPRRKAFAVAALPFGALIEVEFDAVC